MSNSGAATVATVDMWENLSGVDPSNLQRQQDQSESDSVGQEAIIGRLRPLNNRGKIAMRRLADLRDHPKYSHHQQFLHQRTDSPSDNTEEYEQSDNYEFIFALGTLPEFAPLGWRLGRGRPVQKNQAVDLLLLADREDNVAGLHCRFAWIKGGGGFFVIADNLRGVGINLNGEPLKRDQRLIPFRNTIQVGECFFTIAFEKRSRPQEEQFQKELSSYYRIVLRESVPLILPTPSENETKVGNWMLRNPLGRGSFGNVSIVTHAHSGKPAAMKEIWGTASNRRGVDREIKIARTLLSVKHKRLGSPFEMYHEVVHTMVEKQRICKLLDDTWQPSSMDTVDRYLLFCPLATANFSSLIKSNATKQTRAVFFTQVLEGIEFLHNEGIMHRDIKPGNLTVISYDPPQAQIVDFGCATSEKVVLYDRPGTIPYLAPEQREGYTHDCTVDYWACALTGLQLFGFNISRFQAERKEFQRIQKWISAQETHPLLSCCKEMLQIEPQLRLTATAALAVQLQQFRDSPEKTGRRASTSSPAQNQAKKLRD